MAELQRWLAERPAVRASVDDLVLSLKRRCAPLAALHGKAEHLPPLSNVSMTMRNVQTTQTAHGLVRHGQEDDDAAEPRGAFLAYKQRLEEAIA